jgi:hypothetical protein
MVQVRICRSQLAHRFKLRVRLVSARLQGLQEHPDGNADAKHIRVWERTQRREIGGQTHLGVPQADHLVKTTPIGINRAFFSAPKGI